MIRAILLCTIIFLFPNPFKCNKPDNEPTIHVYSETQERTDKGALVASISGVSAEFRNVIDQSLTDVFRDARALGYSKNLEYWNVIIYALHTCTLSPESQTPSFLIRADVYDGTEFDQYNPKGKGVKDGKGRVYAAEFVITHPDWAGLQLTDEYIICQSDDASYVYNATRYGREHKIYFDNDRDKFAATWFHGAGVYHPIMPFSSSSDTLGLTTGAKEKHYVDYGGHKIKGRIKITK